MRASGRAERNEIDDLLIQLEKLDSWIAAELNSDGSEASASRSWSLLFLAEALASTILRILRAVVFERRLGIPKSEIEVLGLFQQVGELDLPTGRRLKQFLELRNLSARNLEQIDLQGVADLLRSRAEWIQWSRGLLAGPSIDPQR